MSEKLPPDDSKSRFFFNLFRKRTMVLCVFVFTSVFFLLVTVRIQLRTEILDLLPARDPIVANYRSIQTSFKQLDLMLIDIGPQDNARSVSDVELMVVADHLSGLLSRSKLFRQLEAQISFEQIDQTLQVLSTYKGNLFTAKDQTMLEKKLTPAAIRETLSQWKKQLYETPAPYLAQMFLRDPLNMNAILAEKLNYTGISANKLKVRNGWMFTADLQHILILCEPRYAAGDEFRSGELTDFMSSAIKQAEAVAESRNVRIAYIANHRFTQINAAMLRSDIKRTMFFSLLSISIIVIFVFRRPVLFGALTLLTACFGGLFATFFMVLLFKDVSAISIGFGAMLMGIVVDFSIHILYHLDQNEQCTRETTIRTISELAKPILITAGTTLIAFLALLLSVLPGYRQIGIFSSLGIIGSLLFAILGVPLLIPRLKPRAHPFVAVTKIYPPFFRWSGKNRKFILFTLCLMTTVAGWGLSRLEFDGDVRHLNASTPAIDRDVTGIVNTYGDPTMVTTVVVNGSNREDALKRNDLLLGELIALQDKGYIQSVSSIAPLVPSASVQQKNFERWKTFWSEERVTRLKYDLQAIASEMRLEPENLLHFLQGIPGDLSIFTPQHLGNTHLTRPLSTRIASNPEGFLVLSSFELTEIGATKQIISMLRSRIPGIFAADGQSLVRRIVLLVKQEMTKLGSITLVFVVIAMISYTRRPARFLRLIVPLLISLFWTFGIMGWLGLKLNIVNNLVVVFVFGLVDDYCLFLYTAWKKYQEGGVADFLSRTSGAITISAATTILGAVALAMASHPVLHSMGTTALIGISMGLIASFLIIPGSRP